MVNLAQVESLYHRALELDSPAGRRAWLADECRDDSGLFQEVWGLLEARAQIAGAAVEAAPLPAGQFGAYRPVRLLGQGGMSAVYLAERADGQFVQTVALKIMAPYLADPEFFRRFDAERQFLASLNHRNITRLLDGGVSSGGDPFLVTEYVDGAGIDRYCDRRKLGVDQRIRIFLQVSEAVDYAHRNLIVHRDLKPANILVNRDGEVKLLDFGAAALTAAQANPAITRMRMVTPRYASPEQLRGERVNIATDVFSLGVVLYELLTGAWPFGDPASVGREFDRSAGRVNAQPLSARITEEAAKARSMSPEQLRRALKSDLSAIVLKALEPEQPRRYDSLRALNGDLENFLAGRPVAARSQTAWYRAGKLLRRQWLPVSVAVAFASAMGCAALVAVRQADAARAEALRADKVNRFLNDMLLSPGGESIDVKNFTVVRMLETAEARLEKRKTVDLGTEGALRQSLGASYSALMQFDRAEAQLDKALGIFQSLGDEKQAAWTLFRLADLANREGRSADAVEGYERVLGRLRQLGKEAPPLLIFYTKDGLGNTLSMLLNRRLADARAFLDEAIALGSRDASIPRTDLAIAVAHSAVMLQNAGKRQEAETMYRRSFAIGRAEDPNGTWQVFPLFGLATLIAPRDPKGAAELSGERYELLAKGLGPGNPLTAGAKILWARQRADAGELPAAAQQVLEAMAIIRQGYLPSSMNLWFALSSSAHVMNQARRYPEAESLAREMLPILEANHLPANDGRRGESLLELGKALYGQKKDREARDVLKQSATIGDAAGPNGAVLARWARALLSKIKVTGRGE
jgi:serine/threonine protein kinase